MKELCTSLSPRMRKAVAEFFEPYYKQYIATRDALCQLASEFPIALCAVYGSMVKGVRPDSDIDILVLLRNDYSAYGGPSDLADELRGRLDTSRVNDIPLDIHVRSVRSFTDTSHGTEFKRSFSEANIVFWEDGVSVDRRFLESSKAV